MVMVFESGQDVWLLDYVYALHAPLTAMISTGSVHGNGKQKRIHCCANLKAMHAYGINIFFLLGNYFAHFCLTKCIM